MQDAGTATAAANRTRRVRSPLEQKRSKASFGNIIRNGVLSSMVRQDFEYFDRTSAGVLQDRLNRDADELGDNLIGFPKEMLEKLVWVCSNMIQVGRIPQHKLHKPVECHPSPRGGWRLPTRWLTAADALHRSF